MAAGTPVVASALDGYQNVATDDLDAVLCEPGDVDGLAAALRRVLAEPELRHRLHCAGLRRADDFSMAALARTYAAIYERLAAEARDAVVQPVGRVPRLRAAVQRMMP